MTDIKPYAERKREKRRLRCAQKRAERQAYYDRIAHDLAHSIERLHTKAVKTKFQEKLYPYEPGELFPTLPPEWRPYAHSYYRNQITRHGQPRYGWQKGLYIARSIKYTRFHYLVKDKTAWSKDWTTKKHKKRGHKSAVTRVRNAEIRRKVAELRAAKGIIPQAPLPQPSIEAVRPTPTLMDRSSMTRGSSINRLAGI